MFDLESYILDRKSVRPSEIGGRESRVASRESYYFVVRVRTPSVPKSVSLSRFGERYGE